MRQTPDLRSVEPLINRSTRRTGKRRCDVVSGGSSTSTDSPIASTWNDESSLPTLHARAIELASADSDMRVSESVSLLVFVVRGRRFCIDLHEVLQVLPLLNLAPVPETPPWVSGIGYHDGVVIVLLDPSTFLGVTGPGISDRRHVIVLGEQEPEFGVLVDRCDEVQTIQKDHLVRLRSESTDAGIVVGVIPEVGEMVDVTSLIREASRGLAQKAAS